MLSPQKSRVREASLFWSPTCVCPTKGVGTDGSVGVDRMGCLQEGGRRDGLGISDGCAVRG